MTLGDATWDVVVVGAGPAGAIAALGLAERGASVLLLERRSWPRRKVCGACLSRGALDLLAEADLGPRLTRSGARPFDRLELCGAGRSATLRLAGSALSRAALDEALVDAARAAGARFESGARAELGPTSGPRRTLSVTRAGATTEVRAAVVVDAAGLGGLGSSEGAPAHVDPRSRVGVGASLTPDACDLDPGTLRMAVGRVGYVGFVRVEDDSLNVAAAVDPDALRGTSPRAAVDAVLEDAGLPLLPDGAVLEAWRGTPTLTRRPAATAEERLLRVGDAAGYVEPFTGEGMCWALASGRDVVELALEAVESWRPELATRWSVYHATGLARARRLCRTIAWGLRRPPLVHAMIVALSVAPALAAPVVRRVSRRPAVRHARRVPRSFVVDPAVGA